MEVCKHRHMHALTSRVSCVLDFRVLSKQGMLTLLRATPASSLFAEVEDDVSSFCYLS